MLRRFAPHIVIVSLVLASISVFVVQKITSDSYIDPHAARSCAELLSLYSAPYRPTRSRALSTTMSMCDYSVQFYDAEEASSAASRLPTVHACVSTKRWIGLGEGTASRC
jgi:hypothetical protein